MIDWIELIYAGRPDQFSNDIENIYKGLGKLSSPYSELSSLSLSELTTAIIITLIITVTNIIIFIISEAETSDTPKGPSAVDIPPRCP